MFSTIINYRRCFLNKAFLTLSTLNTFSLSRRVSLHAQSTLAQVMIRRDLLHPVPAVRHVRRPRHVIVPLHDRGQPLGQIRVDAHQPVFAVGALRVRHVPIEPPLDDPLEPGVHLLRHLGVGLKGRVGDWLGGLD